MFRSKLRDLIHWKDKKHRKPLIVNGARQVGKSWLVKQFGEAHFDNFVTLNLERNKNLHKIFKADFDVQRIVLELKLGLNANIEEGKTLLFFDEIQACSEALGSLRYFYEEMPGLHLIAAGSLLDFEFRNQPFPVGRVESMQLYPLTFYEFLKARKKDQLAKLLEKPPEEAPEKVTSYFEEDFNLYLVIGGMPECVQYFNESNDLLEVQEIQDNLLYTYEQDFKKYQPKVNADCLMDILDNSTKFIGSQTIYSKLSERFSNPTIKKGVDVLTLARVLTRVKNVSVSGLPLTVSGKQFKLFFLDIGLLLRKSNLEYKSLYLKKELTAAFQGLLAEQFVAQQLLVQNEQKLYYWARTKTGASAEIDFVYVKSGKIIPVEVKAGKSGALKSLHFLLNKYSTIEEAIVFSTARQGKEGKIRFVPIYWAGTI